MKQEVAKLELNYHQMWYIHSLRTFFQQEKI